ncbi:MULTISPECIES: hypothetical protein [unclassified Streptomyces]|uniref:hypothetical protein n=1 Tax=unclassified Streptomyces TaxID=2593676 RepID=UPI001660A332|nr:MULTISPECIES: hypothetical protein [unclassified Streptomyces]MBD0711240.1 hypothetical protein [Streptomyces sp. CBMA291]MBD0716189.1 hypothetical protein [Streptomyces sp. CBMA370]
MEATIVTILALLFLSFVALGVFVTVKAVKAAKRGVDRTIDQARRTVEDTTLRAKSLGQTGAAGELARLRLSLRTSMRATQEALQAGVGEDASLKESLDLFHRLSAHGLELDDDLKRLEREPDRSWVSGQLPELAARTARITGSADALRRAARDRALKFAEDDLSALSAQIDVEAGALRHWTGPEHAPGAAGATGGATHGTTGTGSPTGQHGRTGPRAQDERSAITAPDPRRTTYSWEKSARPETTT